LNISRLNAGIVAARMQTLELSVMMTAMQQDQLLRAEECDVTITSEGPSPCWVESDPLLLERIVRNLCENVFEHASATYLNIRWVPEGKHVRLEVSDDGCGIAEADQERVFQPFQQSGSERRQGMGLGLSIVSQLCELLAMPMVFESSPTEGTRFSLTLPTAAAPALERPLPASNRSEEERTASIMVIDDDRAVLASSSALLESWGYQVRTCERPEFALQAIQEQEPDLLLCDYHFEQSAWNGLSLIGDLREKYQPDLPVILISADTHGDLELALHEQLSEGEKAITALAFKPLMPAKLRLMIQHYLKGD